MTLRSKESYKWVVLGISFAIMLAFAISLQFLPPIFKQIIRDIPFSNSQAGMLMGAYAVPGIILPFLVAFLASRYNEKTIIIIALLTLIAGLLAFSISKSFLTLLIFRLIAGIGATALVVLAPLLVTMFFGQDNIGIAMGIFNAGVPTGTVISANLFGVLGEVLRWRLIILGIAIFVAIVLLISLFVLHIPEKGQEENDKEERSSNKSGFGLGLWLIAIIWALANAQFLSYSTFGSQYFQGLGMDVQKAGLLVSFIVMVPIFISPFVGIIIDKTGWKKRLLLAGAIIMAISFVLITKTTSTIILWTITLGLGFAPIPVLVFALLPEMVEPSQVGMGLGVLTSASNLGIALGPMAFGALLDKTGENFNIGFITLALVSLVVILAISQLRTQTR